MVTALIFAGGVGKRMKSREIPKQFLEVEGKPIIIHTLEHFSNHDMVDSIVVVCLESWIDELNKDIKKFAIKKVNDIIPGGKTGFQSIHNGLELISKQSKDDDIVLICDGVRPILSEELITTCVNDTVKFGTAVPVTPSIVSVLYSEDGTSCRKNIERKKIFITQAPQGYRVRTIMDAHDEAIKKGVESVSSGDLMIELGHEIHIFQGIRENIKVTTPEDLNIMRATQYYEHFKNFSREELKYQI
ncbi:MAG: 2-C-methyl-D-erythritol 4-phosphate cytidylyltransferase [Lachnospiraceae bacterium]|nr:2-C-methyl-D-erythritol 4-phosphate cytidylyltransferase [Lachnospiraceae bacterium]